MTQLDTLPPYSDLPDTTLGLQSLPGMMYTDTVAWSDGQPVMQTRTHTSLFTHHTLPVTHTHEIAIQRQGAPGWFLAFIALSFLLSCIYLRSKQINVIDVLQSAVDRRAMDRNLRESNMTHNGDKAPIAVLMLIPVALLLYYYFMKPSIQNTWIQIGQYLLLLLSCTGAYFLRNGLIRFVGSAFENEESVSLYLTSNYVYHMLYGIVATIMCFFVCYTDSMGPIFFKITLGILAFLFISRIIRGMQLILTNSNTLKLYLFYYLCIFEIVPIIIVSKLLTVY